MPDAGAGLLGCLFAACKPLKFYDLHSTFGITTRRRFGMSQSPSQPDEAGIGSERMFAGFVSAPANGFLVTMCELKVQKPQRSD
jgi:hypothetical protein